MGWIIEAYRPGGVMDRLDRARLSLRAALMLKRVREALEGQVMAAYEAYNSLIRKYGEEVDGTWQMGRDNPRWAEFEKEYNDFIESEVEVDIQPIPISLIEDGADAHGLRFNQSEVEALFFISL